MPYFCTMSMTISKLKAKMVSIVLLILLYGCQSATEYKVRRIHNGHSRIAHSYGKREVPVSKDTALIHVSKLNALDESSKMVSNEIQVPLTLVEDETELVVADSTFWNHFIDKYGTDQYCIAPSPKPRANPFEKYVAPEWNQAPQSSESLWGYLFGDFWSVVLIILVVLLIIIVVSNILLYGPSIVAALGSGNWWKVLLVLAFMALLFYLQWLES